MMEVMRVDDHSYKNKKGKIVNPTNSHIRDIEKEIIQSGIMEMFSNAELVINGSTDLPTNKDHNYKYYYKNFVRVVEEHKKSIDLYKKNHPNYKLIFFIMDESSAYFKAQNINDAMKERKVGERVLGEPHFHFMDENFIKVFENLDIDYLVWYTPFKLINSLIGKLDLPEVCMFDIKKTIMRRKKYNADYMVSTEI